MLTFALEGAGGRREQQLVLHGGGLGASRYARLDVIPLDPLGQPAHVAVAVERVGAQRTKQIYSYSVKRLLAPGARTHRPLIDRAYLHVRHGLEVLEGALRYHRYVVAVQRAETTDARSG